MSLNYFVYNSGGAARSSGGQKSRIAELNRNATLSMSIRYTTSLDDIDATMLTGFFEGWPRQPGPDEHFRMLKGSSHMVLAIDETTGRIVGRISAISDGCHSAFVSMFEVLPSYRGRGIGKQMAETLFDDLRHFSSIDLTCAPELRPYYEKFGMQPTTGMAFRNHNRRAV